VAAGAAYDKIIQPSVAAKRDMMQISVIIKLV